MSTTINAYGPFYEPPSWLYYGALIALAYALVVGAVVAVRELRNGRLQRAIQQKCHNTVIAAHDARAAIRAVATDPQTRKVAIVATILPIAAGALIFLVIIGLISHFGPPPPAQPLPA